MSRFTSRIRSTVQLSAVLIVCVLAALQTSSATSAVTTATYRFTGPCNDCAGQGIGTLTVQNYTLGTALSNGNFVSFSYSSNLLNYTITSANLLNLSGTLPVSLPASAAITISGQNNNLVSQTNGVWCAGTGTNCADDFGTGSLWGVPGGGGGSTVPTLSVPAMIGLAVMMVLIGAFLLKRPPNRTAA